MKFSLHTSSLLPSAVLVVTLGFAAMVCAQDGPPPGPCTGGPGRPGGPAGPGHDPKFDAAFKACWSELGGISKHPVAHEMMDKCMEAKGFRRPAGPPPGGPAGPRHDPKFDAALKACWSKSGGTSKHPVAHEMMDKCMEAKGFKRPGGPPPGFGNPPPLPYGS